MQQMGINNDTITFSTLIKVFGEHEGNKIVTAVQLTNFTLSGSTTSLGATCDIDGISLIFGSGNAAALSAWSTSTANLGQATKKLTVQRIFIHASFSTPKRL